MINEIDVNPNEEQSQTKLELASGKLDKKTEKLATRIIREDDPDQIKDLINLFNLNHTKKQVLRTMTYDQLVDNIMTQMKERILKRGDQFSNKDLMDYLNTMNTAMEKAHKQIKEVDAVPPIQVNQQNNTVIMGGVNNLDKASRDRVLDFVRQVLSKSADISEESNISDQITVLNTEDEVNERIPVNEVSEDVLDNLYENDSENESFKINPIKFNEE